MPVQNAPMLSLVIPVYRNQESLSDLLAAVAGLAQGLQGRMEAVFVVDGSPDRCYDILQQRLPQCAFASQLLLLSRNFGAFAAIRAGLELAQGQQFAVMAADLQEPPELVLQMQQLLAQDQADVVVAVRQARLEPWHKRLPSQVFWGLYRRYVIADMPVGGVDIFACNRAFRDTLLQLQERHSSLVAQIFWLGFRRAEVPYVRQARRHGKSAWTWHKKVNYLMDSVFSFSDLPIRLLMRFGALGVAIAVAMALVVAVARLSGAIAVPGYAMTMVTLVFFGALNLFSLGVVGSYAWRAYENTKARPLAVPLRAQGFAAASSPSQQAPGSIDV